MSSTHGFRLALAAILLTAYSSASFGIVYVNYAAAGANNGMNWGNAYTNLKAAVAASPEDSEIWVATGTYYPSTGTTNRKDSLVLKSGMKLYGGFLETMTTLEERNWVTHPTILSGDINIKNNKTDNSDHIIIGAPNAIVDGFTIRNGGDNTFALPVDSATNSFGGGLYVSEIGMAAMKVVNCTFIENNVYYDDGGERPATGKGAAIFVTNSALEVAHCSFIDNWAWQRGGAIYIMNPAGSGSYPVVISNSVFRGNSTRMGSVQNQVGGGAIWADAGYLEVIDCLFSKNRGAINDLVYGFGGAIHLARGGDGTDINKFTRCAFVYNQIGSGQGGGIYTSRDMTIEDCIFTQNRVHTRARGGGIFVARGATATINGSAFSANSCYQNAHFYTWGMDGNLEQGQGAAIASEGTVFARNSLFAGNYSGSTESLGLYSYTTLETSTNYVNNPDGSITTNIVPTVIQTNTTVAAGIKGGGSAFWQKPGSHGGSEFENCTFAENRANKYGGAIFANDLTNSVLLHNCISWNNEAWRINPAETGTYPEMYGTNIVFSFGDITGGWTGPGDRNISVDPLFGVTGAEPGSFGHWTAAPTFDITKGLSKLVDNTASWPTNGHVGRFLNPSLAGANIVCPTAWGGPANYTNHVSGLLFPIVSNTATELYVYGDVRTVDWYWRQNANYTVSGSAYKIHDYHLKALGRRWTPLTATTGRWARDSVHSPCIDAGDWTSDYSNELWANGGRINMGAYGNTAQASSKREGAMFLLR